MKENNIEKRKIIVALVVLILILVIVVGITYAYFSAKSEAEKQQITTAKLNLVVEIDGKSSHIESIKPTIWDDDINQNNNNADIVQIPIKVTNKSTIDVLYSLTLTTDNFKILENSSLSGGSLGDIKYILYSLEENKQITMGDFIDLDYKQKIISEKEISVNATEQYMLYVYIENINNIQNKLQGLSFDVVLNGEIVSNEIKKDQKNLAETILNSEPIIEEEPNFTSESRDRGLYKMNTDAGSIYYYKGSTTNSNIRQYYKMNNYVAFGTYSNEVNNRIWNGTKSQDKIVAHADDPILWRIMRINEDGSIKLIAENNIGDTHHFWNNINNKYDYVINNEDGTKTDSNIKQTVDNWYNEMFGGNELDDLVVESEFCNDRSIVNYNGSNIYAVKYRITRQPQQATLKCANEKDIVKAKAGLISADELTYAGVIWRKAVEENNTTYLDNSGWFWTISSIDSAGALYWETGYSFLNNWYVNDNRAAAARPVITLKADVPFTVDETMEDAPGSKENPYKITVE